MDIGLALQSVFSGKARRRLRQLRRQREADARIAPHYRRFAKNVSAVDRTVALIRDLAPSRCSDISFLEKEFLPDVGLNDELVEMWAPPELLASCGRGLHLWQYPNQFARYLAWLSENATVARCYMEIGARWGGTFIVVAEWLRKVSPTFREAIAVDPIRPSPFIERYMALCAGGPVTIRYMERRSTHADVADQVSASKPDIAFIDGDHSYAGALHDHLLVRTYADIVVHHDISSDSTPDTTGLWKALRQLETGWSFHEFVDQYQSHAGRYCGIGVMQRKRAQGASPSPP